MIFPRICVHVWILRQDKAFWLCFGLLIMISGSFFFPCSKGQHYFYATKAVAMHPCLSFPCGLVPCSYSFPFQGTSWELETRRIFLTQTISLSGTEEPPSRFQGASSTRSPSAQVGVPVGGRAVCLGLLAWALRAEYGGGAARMLQRVTVSLRSQYWISAQCWTSDLVPKCNYPKENEDFALTGLCKEHFREQDC